MLLIIGRAAPASRLLLVVPGRRVTREVTESRCVMVARVGAAQPPWRARRLVSDQWPSGRRESGLRRLAPSERVRGARGVKYRDVSRETSRSTRPPSWQGRASRLAWSRSREQRLGSATATATATACGVRGAGCGQQAAGRRGRRCRWSAVPLEPSANSGRFGIGNTCPSGYRSLAAGFTSRWSSHDLDPERVRSLRLCCRRSHCSLEQQTRATGMKRTRCFT